MGTKLEEGGGLSGRATKKILATSLSQHKNQAQTDDGTPWMLNDMVSPSTLGTTAFNKLLIKQAFANPLVALSILN